jgi:hypothetical protein
MSAHADAESSGERSVHVHLRWCAPGNFFVDRAAMSDASGGVDEERLSRLAFGAS